MLVGHSERCDLFHEDDELINRKLKAALRHGLTPVLCVGEHAVERDAGRLRWCLVSSSAHYTISMEVPSLERLLYTNRYGR